jgi:hypothetical protein
MDIWLGIQMQKDQKTLEMKSPPKGSTQTLLASCNA